MVLGEGAAFEFRGTGSALLTGLLVGLAAVGTAGGGGGRESRTSPERTALTVSVSLPGAIRRVAIARVPQLIGRINPLKAVPTMAKTVLNTQKLSNPSTTHLCYVCTYCKAAEM
jgi:hypothetical protein